MNKLTIEDKGAFFMADKKVLVTEDGYNKLVEKLNYLKSVKRIEIADRLKAAIALGDLSENSEYDDAKNEQAFLEGEIQDLTAKIRNSHIIKAGAGDVVQMGSKVTVKDSLGAQKTVDIEADGTYRVDVADMTGPFLFRAAGTVGAGTRPATSAAWRRVPRTGCSRSTRAATARPLGSRAGGSSRATRFFLPRAARRSSRAAARAARRSSRAAARASAFERRSGLAAAWVVAFLPTTSFSTRSLPPRPVALATFSARAVERLSARLSAWAFAGAALAAGARTAAALGAAFLEGALTAAALGADCL